MGQVATTPTPLTPAQAMGGLLLAGVPQSALLMVAAQSAIETATFGSKTGRGFNNYNFGNVTPTPAQVAAGVPWMNQGLNMKYIAYPDPVSGAKGMLGWLSSHGLLSYASSGDLNGYMQALQAGSYLGTVGLTDGTGHTVSQTDYDNYKSGIAAYMKSLATVTPVAPPMPGGGILGPALVASGLAVAGGVAAYSLYTGKAPWKLLASLLF